MGVVIGVVSQKYVSYSNDAFLRDVLIHSARSLEMRMFFNDMRESKR
jgi:hypothetical protein